MGVGLEDGVVAMPGEGSLARAGVGEGGVGVLPKHETEGMTDSGAGAAAASEGGAVVGVEGGTPAKTEGGVVAEDPRGAQLGTESGNVAGAAGGSQSGTEGARESGRTRRPPARLRDMLTEGADGVSGKSGARGKRGLAKELQGLAPFAWDSRRSLHPVGAAMQQQFGEVKVRGGGCMGCV